MGWYATAKALKNGAGPYGTVRESLRGESDRGRTVYVAIRQIQAEIDRQDYVPDRAAKSRLLWWARWAGSLTPHQPDAAITPAGGGSELSAAQVMSNG